MNKIHEAFETVKADEKLKASAMEAVRKKLKEEEKRKALQADDLFTAWLYFVFSYWRRESLVFIRFIHHLFPM